MTMHKDQLKKQHLLFVVAVLGIVVASVRLWTHLASESTPVKHDSPGISAQLSAALPPVIFSNNELFEIIPVAEADDIPHSEFVIGVEAGGKARAYAMAVMGVELGNDVLGGQPIAVGF